MLFIFFPGYMFKNILTHNIFFPEYMGQGFIPTLQPTGSSSGLHQEKGGTYPQPSFKIFSLTLCLCFCFWVACYRESPQEKEGRWPWKPTVRWQHQPVFIFTKAWFIPMFCMMCCAQESASKKLPFHLLFCLSTFLFYPFGFFYDSETLGFWVFILVT